MTKAKFFGWCRKATTGSPDEVPELKVTWRMEYHGLERVVYLQGSWFNNTIVDIELYRPLPGRQGRDYYQTAIRLCEEATKKYRRWLEEYKSAAASD